MAQIKGNMVKLQTFLKWGIGNVFGHKEKEIEYVIYVNEIWCKVCAKNKAVIMRNADVKGAKKITLCTLRDS